MRSLINASFCIQFVLRRASPASKRRWVSGAGEQGREAAWRGVGCTVREFGPSHHPAYVCDVDWTLVRVRRVYVHSWDVRAALRPRGA